MKKNTVKILSVCSAGVLHCILSLWMWVIIVAELNIPTGPTFDPFVYYASFVVWFPSSLLAWLGLLPVSSLFFPVLLVLNSIGLAFFLYRWLNRGENIRQEKDTVHSKPKSITVICWISIITGVFSLVVTTIDFYNSPADPEAAENPISFFLHVILIYTPFIIMLISGVAMLKGKNWARLLYIVWVVISLIIQMITSPVKAEIIPNVFLSAIIVFFLFRPRANNYFRKYEGNS
ncbi:MAG: hypothetical protein Q3M30_01475 [Candidatus Electrothrix sp. Rat3]|nr:hypothetical protein [Candidatus Electrothrix rattekaaiensis]